MPRRCSETDRLAREEALLRLAITGVAGFIGSHLAERFVARGDSVSGIDDLSHGDLQNLAALSQHPSFRFQQGSILDPAALSAAVAGADVLLHLAASKIPRYGDALDTLVTNSEGGLQVLRAAHQHGVRRFVLASTSDCYGRNPAVPFSEESASVIGSPLVRRWSYAVSKMLEEQALFAYKERHGMEAVALRLFGGYGPRQHLSWWGGPQAVFITAALKGEPLELHGTGGQTRSFTYVDDIVEGFVAAADVPGADGELFNIGSDREISIEGLARLIWGLVRDDEPRLRLVPYASFGRYEDVERRVPDSRKAARVLGHSPAVRLEDGMTLTVAWQRDRLKKAGLL